MVVLAKPRRRDRAVDHPSDGSRPVLLDQLVRRRRSIDFVGAASSDRRVAAPILLLRQTSYHPQS